MKKNKYNAIKTFVNGNVFASKKEAARYNELRALEVSGVISNLTLQPLFLLQEGFKWRGRTVRPIKYVADFKYTEGSSGKVVVEDVKGIETPVFKLKAKILKYNYKDIDFRVIN